MKLFMVNRAKCFSDSQLRLSSDSILVALLSSARKFELWLHAIASHQEQRQHLVWAPFL